MEPIYRIQFPVTTNDVDRFCRLKASSLLNMLQDAAGAQCAAWQMDWESLAEKGYFWAIIRQRVQITRLPGPGSAVTVETWPGVTTRVAYPRHSIGYDEQGNELFRAVSLWVLMDLNTRAMVLPGKSGVDVAGIDRPGQLPIPASLGVIRPEQTAVRAVRFSELDRNGHMSNTRCLDWAADLPGSGFHQGRSLSDFTVCYLSEAKENEAVSLGYALEDGVLSLEASGEGHRVFALKLRYREN